MTEQAKPEIKEETRVGVRIAYVTNCLKSLEECHKCNNFRSFKTTTGGSDYYCVKKTSV